MKVKIENYDPQPPGHLENKEVWNTLHKTLSVEHVAQNLLVKILSAKHIAQNLLHNKLSVKHIAQNLLVTLENINNTNHLSNCTSHFNHRCEYWIIRVMLSSLTNQQHYIIQ